MFAKLYTWQFVLRPSPEKLLTEEQLAGSGLFFAFISLIPANC
jgi:hypothetical protein